MASLASINVAFRADFAQFSEDMQKILNEVKVGGQDLAAIGDLMTAGITMPALAGAGVLVSMGTELESSMGKVDKVFGQSAEEVKAWAKTAIDQYGVAESKALSLAGTFGDLASSVSLPEGVTLSMSKELAGLTSDLAAFKDVSLEQSEVALKGIFTGETESLRALGIVMNETTLKSFALAEGIRKPLKDFTEAEKVQLRYNYVMKQTAKAQGAFLESAGEYGSETQKLKQSIVQIGQSFGSLLLPYISKAVTQINGLVSSFTNLPVGVQKSILVIGGIAAAIGPVLSVAGRLISVIPNVVAQVASLGTSFKALQATLAANPYVAMVASLAIVSAAVIGYIASINNTVTASELLAEVNEKVAASIAKEVSTVNALMSIAKDETRSKKERYEAVKKLNEISPEHLGNLKLETIATKESTAAIEGYISAIRQKARQQAIASKMTELEQKRLELMGKDLHMTNNALTSGAQKLSNWAWALVGVKTQTISTREELENYINSNKLTVEQIDALRKAYEPLIQQRDKEVKSIDDQIKALEGFIDVSTIANGSDQQSLAIAEKKNSVMRGSIAYYEKQIEALKKRQKEVTLNSDAWWSLEQQILEYENRIALINGQPIKFPKPEAANFTIDIEFDIKVEKTVEFYDNEIARLTDLRDKMSKTKEDYIRFSEAIEDLKWEKKQIEVDVESFRLSQENIEEMSKRSEDQSKERSERIAAFHKAAAEGVLESFNVMGAGIVESLGLAETGIQGFVKVMAQTVVKLISMVMAESIANAIKGATQSGNATGPGAVFTTPAFIAAAVGGVMAAFAAIPKFNNGGVVEGGTSFGDRILTLLNAGELVLNNRQQKNLHGMLAASGAGNVVLNGGWDISGDMLRLVLERHDKKNNRKS